MQGMRQANMLRRTSRNEKSKEKTHSPIISRGWTGVRIQNFSWLVRIRIECNQFYWYFIVF